MKALNAAYDFWKDKTSPLNRDSESGHYERWALEIKILFGTRPIGKVLEIGCGTGTFYPLLEFDKTDYTGIDISETMLGVFCRNHPVARLICDSGHAFKDNNSYDTIFSNTVLQYFDHKMLDLHFRQAKEMLSAERMVFCCSIPWRVHRLSFYSGEIGTPLKRSLRKMIRGYLRSFRMDPLGIWHTPREIEKVASNNGLTGEYFGSVLYPYRFHAVLSHWGCFDLTDGKLGRQSND